MTTEVKTPTGILKRKGLELADKSDSDRNVSSQRGKKLGTLLDKPREGVVKFENVSLISPACEALEWISLPR